VYQEKRKQSAISSQRSLSKRGDRERKAGM
jgi:hypothetical protein